MSIQTDLAVQERENEFHIDQVLALLDERDGQEALSDTQLIEFVYLAAVACQSCIFSCSSFPCASASLTGSAIILVIMSRKARLTP